ncbi:DNA-directed DNA polymerase II small subunit [Candidatus Woesearchaeota archaeon]|nr:DNA-directed DNA polymerase II small subunit [Candidatus Woesearchaeota archaeon]
MDKEKLIEELFEKGILVNKELLEKGIDLSSIEKIKSEADLIVLNSDYVDVLKQQTTLVDWYEIDKNRVEAEKDRDDELYQTQLQHFKQSSLKVESPHFQQNQQVSSLEIELDYNKKSSNFITTSQLNQAETKLEVSLPNPNINQPSTSITLITSYKNIPHKYSIPDFANFFHSRYRFLEGLLRHRQELQGLMTINRILTKKEKETVSLIGLVEEISETKNGNLIITLEDPTGKIKTIISKNRKEIYSLGKELVVDEVIGLIGTCSDKVIFTENIIWPDIPNDHKIIKSEEEEYAIFLSDIHVGSKLFLKEEFERFLRWINSSTGSESQREISQKVKYIFIAGDLVDGIGIYPSQEEELAITDINEQYKEFINLIKQIPIDKQIIICPGNHDMIYLAEPQPAFYLEYAPELFQLPNVTLITNPGMVNIGKTKTFSGFDILLYHGYSFDYYIANVESIRNNGGYHRADLIMKFLLKRRHLAPSFKSTPYFPGHQEDSLLIKKIPDFFITGHIHYSNVANYKGVTMISGSCWQGKTSFQEKLGHEPEPARVPVVNLKTREVKILRFG